MNTLEKTVLERWSEGDYKEYRIPGIIATAAGTILCCYEARKADCNDWARTDIILARSTDGGKTFGKYLIVKNAQEDDHTYGNPVLIADGDLVHFIWHLDYERAFYQVSRDAGVTFSEPMEITDAFREYTDRFPWTVIASGPGHGIALRNGRLVLPVWLAQGASLDEQGRRKAHSPSVAGAIYSDDRGKSWHAGDIVPGLVNGNETTAAELPDGKVLFNIRHTGPQRYRAVSITTDGIHGFSEPYYDRQLPDPVCFGSSVKAADSGIWFANCANGTDSDRINLTLRYSTDGRTWVRSERFDPVGGYADICVLDDSVCAFYEQTVHWEGRSVIGQLVFRRLHVQGFIEL